MGVGVSHSLKSSPNNPRAADSLVQRIGRAAWNFNYHGAYDRLLMFGNRFLGLPRRWEIIGEPDGAASEPSCSSKEIKKIPQSR